MEANMGKITAFEMKPGHVYLISPSTRLTPDVHRAMKADWREIIAELPEDQRPTVLVNGSPVSVVEVVQPAVVMTEEHREEFREEWSRIHSRPQPQYEPQMIGVRVDGSPIYQTAVHL